MSTPETVPVPVELLVALRDGPYRTPTDEALIALIPEPDPHEVAVEAIAETMQHTAVPTTAIPNMALIDRTARAALATLLDLGWTPPEET